MKMTDAYTSTYPRPRLLITIGVAALLGLLTALTMPRGPATAGQALLVMGSTLLAGLLAGLLLRRRWAMLLAPAVYITAV